MTLPIPDPTQVINKQLHAASMPTKEIEKFSLKPEVESTLRNYQWELALPGLSGQNYIICAPTGTGKTRVAGLIISEHLKRLKGKGKVVFIVNKVILTHQQKVALEEMIVGAKVDEITGEVATYRKSSLSPVGTGGSSSTPAKLANSTDDIIVCTAGCFLNELRCKKLKITSISLIIIDECHHTKKNADYAKIMEYYLREKMSSKLDQRDEPAGTNSKEISKTENGCLSTPTQVIGLTATPGAEANLSATMEHLMSLCARMDAIGGIKIVHKHAEELEKHRNKPKFTLATLNGRSQDEEFISIIDGVMSELERMLNLKNVPQGATHWSQPYTTWVVQTMREYQSKGLKNQRNYVSTLELLRSLSRTLATYMDLRFEDAMEIFEEFSLPSPDNATKLEQRLDAVVSQMKDKLRSLELIDNPMLVQLADILSKQFTRQPESRAMIFVETKKQAASISDWILSSEKLHIVANIHPKTVTGQMGETGLKMSKAVQDKAIKKFHEGTCNLLVATSVLEEGIDIPACNLVIRYQKVTSEIAKVQTQGRARAEDSQSITIISSDSKKEYRELINEEKISLVEEAMKLLPSGELLQRTITERQREILQGAAATEKSGAAVASSKEQYSPFEVDLHCKKCRTFMCNGSQVKTLNSSLQYIVIDENFRSRIKVVDHHNPASVPNGMSRTHKIYCSECDQDFGVMGRWWKDHGVHPVIKCCNFLFKIGGGFHSYKKWSVVPFAVGTIKS
jgi:ERCC4-related helicase